MNILSNDGTENTYISRLCQIQEMISVVVQKTLFGDLSPLRFNMRKKIRLLRLESIPEKSAPRLVCNHFGKNGTCSTGQRHVVRNDLPRVPLGHREAVLVVHAVADRVGEGIQQDVT